MSNSIDLIGGEDAVLLIHGLTGSPFEMKYLAKRLHREGFTVRVPCLAGHGTDISDLRKTGWRDWYGTVAEAFADLKKNHRTVAVSGLCMGAVLALQLAYEAGDKVSALSLLSTTLYYDGWSLPWYRFLLPIVLYTPVKHFYSFREREPFGVKNEQVRGMIAQGMNDGLIAYPSFPSQSLSELFRLIGSVKKVIPEVKSPTLLIHSVEDDVSSMRSAEYIERNIGSSEVRKILLTDSYHMVTIDNQKNMVMDETTAFFMELAKSKSDGKQRIS